MERIIKSIIKKAKNLKLDAYAEGRYNFENKTDEFEQLAKERADICKGCEFRETEPIKRFRVEDEIKEISGKYCGACGCTLSYLLRQNVKGCKLKKWK